MEGLARTTAPFYAALDAQDWRTVEQLVTPDFVASVGDSPPLTVAAWRQQLEAFYQGFPDGHHLIDEYVTSDSAVVTNCPFAGTHSGAFHDSRPPAVVSRPASSTSTPSATVRSPGTSDN